MQQIGGWYDGTAHEPEVRVEALVERWLGDDLGMTDGIAAVLVDVRVQAHEIVVEDAFVTFHVSVELVGVGTSTEEGVAWIERARGLVRLQEGLDGGIGNT